MGFLAALISVLSRQWSRISDQDFKELLAELSDLELQQI
jgi:hypothetical protein